MPIGMGVGLRGTGYILVVGAATSARRGDVISSHSFGLAKMMIAFLATSAFAPPVMSFAPTALPARASHALPLTRIVRVSMAEATAIDDSTWTATESGLRYLGK